MPAPPDAAPALTPRPAPPHLTVVATALNEAENLEALHAAVGQVLWPLEQGGALAGYTLLVVDDGSRDRSVELLRRLRARDHRVKYLAFSRNFGKQAAIRAGLDAAQGDVVVVMDSDLEQPPELLPTLLERWQAGYDVVTTRRRPDPRLSALKRTSSRLYYRVLSSISDIELGEGASDYVLLDARVVQVLREQVNESYFFFRGLVAWVGFRQTEVPYTQALRRAGQSKFNLLKLTSQAINSITSFSTKPLRLATVLGMLLLLFAVAGGVYALYSRYAGIAVAGWTSVVIIVLVVGGVQTLLIGIIGEYLGKLFMEAKGRPRYIVREAAL